MSFATLDEATRSRLRTELEAVPGVRRAVVEASPSEVFVIADPSDAAPTELIVRAILARHGLSPQETEVQFCHTPTPQPRRRVRFLSARVESPRAGRARAAVELEWGGTTYADAIEGETGPAVELRLAALATIRTLEAVLHGSLTFQLVGIKALRAFDSDLVVVMLSADQGPGQTLVGASLANESPYRSAALAVLNATNRYLGNYLANLDAT